MSTNNNTDISLVFCAAVGVARSADIMDSYPVADIQAAQKIVQALAKDSTIGAEDLHKEKYRISPGCATCPSPCQRHADAAPEDFVEDTPAQRAARLSLIDAIGSMDKGRIQSEEQALTVLRAVFFAGESWANQQQLQQQQQNINQL